MLRVFHVGQLMHMSQNDDVTRCTIVAISQHGKMIYILQFWCFLTKVACILALHYEWNIDFDYHQAGSLNVTRLQEMVISQQENKFAQIHFGFFD